MYHPNETYHAPKWVYFHKNSVLIRYVRQMWTDENKWFDDLVEINSAKKMNLSYICGIKISFTINYKYVKKY